MTGDRQPLTEMNFSEERQNRSETEQASGDSAENGKINSDSPPPPYYQINQPVIEDNSTTSPPTYEEVQRQKAIEAGLDPCIHQFPVNEGINGSSTPQYPLGNAIEFNGEIDEQILGTDLMFFIAFTATFIFNWVGFVLLLCFCHTIAGRTGALAGFGLSLAKWTVIVRHSIELHDPNSYWLLWFVMVLGLLVFVKGVMQYVNAKKEFLRLPSTGRQLPSFNH